MANHKIYQESVLMNELLAMMQASIWESSTDFSNIVKPCWNAALTLLNHPSQKKSAKGNDEHIMDTRRK